MDVCVNARGIKQTVHMVDTWILVIWVALESPLRVSFGVRPQAETRVSWERILLILAFGERRMNFLDYATKLLEKVAFAIIETIFSPFIPPTRALTVAPPQ